jgi:ATP-binding cassette, subfamily B, bacterial PglK
MINIEEYSQTKELLSFLSARRRTQLGLIGVLMIIGSLAEVASIGLVIPFLGALTSPELIFQKQFLSPVIQYFGIVSPGQLLLPFTLIFIVAVIFSGIIRLLLLYATISFSHAVGHDLGVNIYRRTLFQSYSFHSSQNSSEIINGIVLKINTITGGIIRPLLTIMTSFFFIIGIISALIYIDTKTSLLAFFGFGLIYFIVIKFTHKILYKNGQKIAYYSTQVIKSLQEGLGGIRDVLIDGTQSFFSTIYKNSDLSSRKASATNTFIGGSPRFILESLGMVLIAILAYSLTSAEKGFESVIPTLGALALGAQRLLPAMQQLYESYSTIKGAQASLDDVLKLLRRNLPVYERLTFIKPLKVNKDIILKNISFRYSNDLPWVLNNINLRFEVGSRIGFIGETGSGKSTLLDILMGLIEPTSGELLIDDELINRENRHNWWRNIAHVPQSIFLSDTTIKDNIAFGIDKNIVKHGNVEYAAKMAQINDMINELPKGYQTNVGERGVRLSGGQKQRIGIARALYKNVPILILDEATSSLDTKTEGEVMKSIDSLSQKLTVFFVAHRISTLKNCDIIYVLDKGEIAKSLTYDELVKDKDNFQLRFSK